MKKVLLFIGIIVFCLAPTIPIALAQDAGEIAGDKEAIKDERQDIKENASAARQEEKQLRDRIHTAIQAGDMETARNLKEQLKVMHQENVRKMQQDKREMKDARQELKQDIRQAHPEGDFSPRRDRDGNPPGPIGGPGTNWENLPGPVGGPGASPDRHPRIDKDNNPPGPRGGRGTNWENPPGPRGGRGASPNRKPRR